MTGRLLHTAARIAIRLWPPLTAKRRVDALGSLLPPIDFDQASRLSERLHGGSCLSRALVIASRMPGAQVVIGARRASGQPLEAHAWVEVAGRHIGLDGPRTELARLK
jgi:hypothetical protein